MAEFLIRARDNRTGTYVKGDVVEIRANDAFYAAEEGLPDFCVVKVPALSMAQVRQYMARWKPDIVFSVIAQDPAIDGYRLELSNALAGVTAGQVTRVQVEAFINRWNGTVVSVSPNAVRFDITVFDAVKSQGFWDHDLVGFAFQELSYDETAGVHQVQVNYSASGRNPTAVENYIESRVDSIVSHSGSVITCEVSRATVRNVLQEDIKRAAEQVDIRTRRYYIDPAQVDTIVREGGTVTVTQTQLMAPLRDRTLE